MPKDSNNNYRPTFVKKTGISSIKFLKSQSNEPADILMVILPTVLKKKKNSQELFLSTITV